LGVRGVQGVVVERMLWGTRVSERGEDNKEGGRFHRLRKPLCAAGLRSKIKKSASVRRLRSNRKEKQSCQAGGRVQEEVNAQLRDLIVRCP